MDRPEFGFGNIKMAFENKINNGRGTGLGAQVQNAISLPVKFFREVFKNVGDFSRSIVDGTVAIGSQIAKVFDESFRKQEKQPVQ